MNNEKIELERRDVEAMLEAIQGEKVDRHDAEDTHAFTVASLVLERQYAIYEPEKSALGRAAIALGMHPKNTIEFTDVILGDRFNTMVEDKKNLATEEEHQARLKARHGITD